MNLNQIKLKISDYFDKIVNEIDLKAECLLDQYQNGDEKDLSKIESLRQEFLEEIFKCRKTNYDYLNSLKDRELDFYVAEAVNENGELNLQKGLKQICCLIKEPYYKIQIESCFGLLLVLDSKYLHDSNLSEIKNFFSEFERFYKIENDRNNETLIKPNFHAVYFSKKFNTAQLAIYFECEELIENSQFCLAKIQYKPQFRDKIFLIKLIDELDNPFMISTFIIENLIISSIKSKYLNLFKISDLKFSFSNKLEGKMDKSANIIQKMHCLSKKFFNQINPKTLFFELFLFNKESITNLSTIECFKINELILNQSESLKCNDLPKYYEDFNLSNLNNLQKLTIIHCSIENLTRKTPKLLSNLVSLNELKLENIPSLNSIDSDLFYGLVNLENLKISKTGIKILKENLFRNVNNLKSINLMHNNLMQIEPGTFNGLTNLKTLVLVENHISEIDDETFKGLANLIDLELNEYKEVKLGKNCFKHFKLLETLRFCLKHIKLEKDLNGLVNVHVLKDLNISEASPNVKNFELFSNKNNTLSKLKIVGIHQDQNYAICPEFDLSSFQFNFLNGINIKLLKISNLTLVKFENLQNLKRMRFYFNQMINIEPGSFRKLSYLEIIEIDSNMLQYISSKTFTGLNRLVSLNLSCNNIKKLEPYCFSELKNLTNLHLYKNSISHLDKTCFYGLENLRILDLSRNNLEFNASEIDAPFIYLRKLETLLLNYNPIKYFPKNLFLGLENLKILSMIGNCIERIEKDSFIGLRSLYQLDLGSKTNNNLKFIDNSSTYHLKYLKYDILKDFYKEKFI